ncbi:unnamed protein product [Angiostrongylus costaricensis]|uniref:Transmembrane protein n=1 Tax=Angiostrongylus costaricensis TaxID=334426 RepID=A0A0R3PMR8_ANGCS|nr:unnamed protein product [Angiostrongylus costaricensis]
MVAADYAYDIDDFNVKLWSMIYVPPGAAAKFNHVASLNIIICFVCIAMFQVLSRFNKKQCSVYDVIGVAETRRRQPFNAICDIGEEPFPGTCDSRGVCGVGVLVNTSLSMNIDDARKPP